MFFRFNFFFLFSFFDFLFVFINNNNIFAPNDHGVQVYKYRNIRVIEVREGSVLLTNITCSLPLSNGTNKGMRTIFATINIYQIIEKEEKNLCNFT